MNALPILAFALTLPALTGSPVEGVVQPFRQVELSSPVASRILEMKVKEGDAVKAGQPLAQLYGRLEELEMQRTKALLERREYEAKGARSLFDNKVIPETQARESGIELELARLRYETAAEEFRLRTILSPIDGLVTRSYREVGEAVSAVQPVFRILDLSKVLIQCSLKAEDLPRLALGQKLAVRIMDETYEGEVTLVAPQADPEGLFRVKVQVENPGARIRAGLKALVSLPEPRKASPPSR